MRKLNKNFREQKKTVEAMQGACSMYGSCSCSAVQDCGCNPSNSNQQYTLFVRQGANYKNSFRDSAF